MKFSEFDVQVVAYNKLNAVYPNIRGEFKYRPDKTKPGCRFDIAVFDNNWNLLFTVEVKKNPNTFSTNQGKRYEALSGVPCFYIRGMEQAENILQNIKI